MAMAGKRHRGPQIGNQGSGPGGSGTKPLAKRLRGARPLTSPPMPDVFLTTSPLKKIVFRRPYRSIVSRLVRKQRDGTEAGPLPAPHVPGTPAGHPVAIAHKPDGRRLPLLVNSRNRLQQTGTHLRRLPQARAT